MVLLVELRVGSYFHCVCTCSRFSWLDFFFWRSLGAALGHGGHHEGLGFSPMQLQSHADVFVCSFSLDVACDGWVLTTNGPTLTVVQRKQIRGTSFSVCARWPN